MDGWTRDEDDDGVRALIPLLSNGLLSPFHVWENGPLLAEGRGAMLVFGSDGLMGCAMPNGRVRYPRRRPSNELRAKCIRVRPIPSFSI